MEPLGPLPLRLDILLRVLSFKNSLYPAKIFPITAGMFDRLILPSPAVNGRKKFRPQPA